VVKENAKRLYDFYVETKQDVRAKELLNKYPDFEKKKEEPKKEKVKKSK
jgi:hypothetical protein